MKFMLAERLEIKANGSARVFGSLVIMAVVTVIAVFAYLQIERQLSRSRSVESDNRTWVLSQIEVDALQLDRALLAAQLQPGPDALARVRLAYDILYSRVDLVRRAPTLEELSIRESEGWKRLAGEDGLVARLLPLIDGPDDQLIAALPEMIVLANETDLLVREAVVDSVARTMSLSDTVRAELRQTLITFMVALVILLIALALLLLTVYLQAQAQRKHARMLELAVHNLRATIESSRDAVLIVDSNDKAIGVNKAGERMIGREISPDFPMRLSELLVADDGTAPGPESQAQIRCRREDGTLLPVELTIGSARTATGHKFKIAFLRDMSDQLERESRLSAALEAARRGEETKDRFLAVMSHEMRTPLFGLLSAIDLMESTTQLDAQQTSLMDIMRGSGISALEQVNNVLELTRLASHDATDYPASSFVVGEAVCQQLRQYEVLAVRRGTKIRFAEDKACKMMIRASLPLLRRIVNNLLSNAIKFTRDGFIDVTLQSREGNRPGFCHFTLSIRDTGIGIDEKDLGRIFENFHSIDTLRTNAQEGTGLGLGIAKMAAEAMGGSITVESRLGEGSCFHATFEAEAADVQAPAAEVQIEESADLPPLEILLAEDNEINRLLLERQLTRIGHHVVTVSDGQEAIDMVAQRQFDIVLMDISMPRVDGVTATRRMREQGLLGHTPVIALTAQAAPNRVQMLRDAGMVEVVIKPVSLVVLDQIMRQQVALAQPAGQLPAPAAEPADSALIDEDQLAELIEDMGGDFLRDMVAKFDTDMSSSISEMAAAIQRNDVRQLSHVAHKAAGMAAVLTFSALSAELRQLETAATEEPGETLAQRCDRVADIRGKTLARMRQRLQAAA